MSYRVVFLRFFSVSRFATATVVVIIEEDI